MEERKSTKPACSLPFPPPLNGTMASSLSMTSPPSRMLSFGQWTAGRLIEPPVNADDGLEMEVRFRVLRWVEEAAELSVFRCAPERLRCRLRLLAEACCGAGEMEGNEFLRMLCDELQVCADEYFGQNWNESAQLVKINKERYVWLVTKERERKLERMRTTRSGSCLLLSRGNSISKLSATGAAATSPPDRRRNSSPSSFLHQQQQQTSPFRKNAQLNCDDDFPDQRESKKDDPRSSSSSALKPVSMLNTLENDSESAAAKQDKKNDSSPSAVLVRIEANLQEMDDRGGAGGGLEAKNADDNNWPPELAVTLLNARRQKSSSMKNDSNNPAAAAVETQQEISLNEKGESSLFNNFKQRFGLLFAPNRGPPRLLHSLSTDSMASSIASAPRMESNNYRCSVNIADCDDNEDNGNENCNNNNGHNQDNIEQCRKATDLAALGYDEEAMIIPKESLDFLGLSKEELQGLEGISKDDDGGICKSGNDDENCCKCCVEDLDKNLEDDGVDDEVDEIKIHDATPTVSREYDGDGGKNNNKSVNRNNNDNNNNNNEDEDGEYRNDDSNDWINNDDVEGQQFNDTGSSMSFDDEETSTGSNNDDEDDCSTSIGTGSSSSAGDEEESNSENELSSGEPEGMDNLDQDENNRQLTSTTSTVVAASVVDPRGGSATPFDDYRTVSEQKQQQQQQDGVDSSKKDDVIPPFTANIMPASHGSYIVVYTLEAVAKAIAAADVVVCLYGAEYCDQSARAAFELSKAASTMATGGSGGVNNRTGISPSHSDHQKKQQKNNSKGKRRNRVSHHITFRSNDDNNDNEVAEEEEEDKKTNSKKSLHVDTALSTTDSKIATVSKKVTDDDAVISAAITSPAQSFGAGLWTSSPSVVRLPSFSSASIASDSPMRQQQQLIEEDHHSAENLLKPSLATTTTTSNSTLSCLFMHVPTALRLFCTISERKKHVGTEDLPALVFFFKGERHHTISGQLCSSEDILNDLQANFNISPPKIPAGKSRIRHTPGWHQFLETAKARKIERMLASKRKFSTVMEIIRALGCSDDKSCALMKRSYDRVPPTMIFLGGGMGAGKSSVVRILGATDLWKEIGQRLVMVAADELKQRDPVFHALNADGIETSSQLVHAYSTEAAETLLLRAVSMRRDVVFDGTMTWLPFVEQTVKMVRDDQHLYRRGPGYVVHPDGSVTEEYWRKIPSSSTSSEQQKNGEDKSKENNEDDNGDGASNNNNNDNDLLSKSISRRMWPGPPYRMHLIGVTVDPQVAIERSIVRQIATGRGVPVLNQLMSHRQFSENFEKYVPMFDEVTLYDNNGDEPTVIAMKRAGGPLEILDQAAYNRFLRKKDLNPRAQNVFELSPTGEYQPALQPTRRKQ